MKNLLVLAFIFFFSVGGLFAQTPIDGTPEGGSSTGGTPIQIDPVPKPSGQPRTPQVADIEACLLGDTLTIIFNVNLGNADIQVTNTSTGDVWYDGVYGIASTSILLLGDNGYYRIAIYTDSGYYEGEFHI